MKHYVPLMGHTEKSDRALKYKLGTSISPMFPVKYEQVERL